MKTLILILVLLPIFSIAQVKEEHPIPQIVIDNCNTLIISKVGEENFKKYYQFMESSGYTPGFITHCGEIETVHLPQFNIHYNFNITLKSFSRNPVQIITDTLGIIISNTGIPDCLNSPYKCAFISKDHVVNIAKENGLQKGIKPWEQFIRWNGDGYAWEVKAYSGERSGASMFINANTGEVIGTDPWAVTIN